MAAHSEVCEHPHVPVEAWHTGVAPEHAAKGSQPVRVALQICGTPSLQRLCPTSHWAGTHWPLLQIGALLGQGVLPVKTPPEQVLRLVPSAAHSVLVLP
jgi:hypothetical protein